MGADKRRCGEESIIMIKLIKIYTYSDSSFGVRRPKMKTRNRRSKGEKKKRKRKIQGLLLR